MRHVIVHRLDLTGSLEPLDTRISELCAVNEAGGYELVTAFVVGQQLILIFKKS